MAIFVTWEDLEGEMLADVVELLVLQRLFPDEGACLPYCAEDLDARFNKAQFPLLSGEVDALDPLAEDERAELAALKALVSRAVGANKGYMAFYGEKAGN